jgi:hypothetical protein
VRIDRRLVTIERQGIERPGSGEAAVEGPSTETPALEGSSSDERPRTHRVIGGSIAPRQDIPRLDR